jgi:hypothetical protein
MTSSIEIVASPPPPDGAVAEAPSTGAVRSHVRRTRLLVVLVGVIVAAPSILAGIRVVGSTWAPAGDWAMLELRTLDITSTDAPLLGPYSRFGWNHPGPLLFVVLGVPYHLSGQASWVLLAAAAAINAAAVLMAAGLAWRRGGVLLAGLVGIALVVVQGSLGAAMLRDPWNPWVTVLPFAVVILAAWSCLEGDRWAPVVLAVTGSFLAQAHLGFTPVVTVLTAMAAVSWLVRRQPLKPLLLGAGVLSVCWLPTMADAVGGERNALAVARHFGSDRSGDVVGLEASLGVAATQLSADGPWRGEDERISAQGGVEPGSSTGLTWPVVAMIGSALVGAVTRNLRALRFQLTIVVTALTGVVSVSRIDGAPYDYLIRWWWPLAALWWVAASWPLCAVVATGLRRVATHRQRAAPRRVVVGSAILGASILVIPALDDDATTPAPEWTTVVRATSAQAVEALGPEGTAAPVVLRRVGPLSGWAKDGIALELTKADIDVKVFDDGINREKFGRHRLLENDTREVTELFIVTGDEPGRPPIPATAVPIAHHTGSAPAPAVTIYVEPDKAPFILEDGRSPLFGGER